MTLARQGAGFVVVGACLLGIDWGVFVGLTALGLWPPVANVLGRIAGASVGFWANGSFTFGTPRRRRLGGRRLLRFAVLWIALTLLSTLLITLVAHRSGLSIAWIAKPLVEAGLGIVSFFVSRHWVYR